MAAVKLAKQATLFKVEAAPDPVRPFLKYPGGKRKLVPDLLALMPTRFRAYHEPFVGGGALFWAMSASLRKKGKPAHLSDAQAEIMNCYTEVRDDVESIIRALDRCAYDPEEYYTRRAEGWRDLSPAKAAVRTLYLNKTCFNGLFRVNKSGAFNVPFGHYENPTICDAENLRACSAAMQGVWLTATTFEESFEKAEKGDLVYCDPPYIPLSTTSSFTAYTAEGFTDDDQARLGEEVRKLVARGVAVIVSNADVPRAREIYQGMRIERAQMARSINAKAEKRGAVGEVLICGGF